MHRPLKHCCAGAACLLLLAGAACAAEIDLRPSWDASIPLANPHKGWYHHYPDNHIKKYEIRQDSDLTNFPGMDHLYLRLAWAYLEPEEGKFRWEVIDDLIKKWTGHGLGIAFRISCKETSVDRIEQQFATPRWVRDAGAQGGHYRKGQPAGPDGPWEPVYDDPIFMAKLEKFLAAFAARYDGKPWVRYVDIGSVGDWGEGHTSSGSKRVYGYDALARHVDLHLKCFKHTQLVISDDFVFGIKDLAERQRMHAKIVDNAIGYRDDSILVDWYVTNYSKTFTVRSPEFFRDVWLKTPTVLELEHYGGVKERGNWNPRPGSSLAKFGGGQHGADYFRGALEVLHASYIGYHGYAHEWLADNPQLTVELLNRCGYWFFPHKLELPDKLGPGTSQPLTIAWQNRGVARAYHGYNLIVRLDGPKRFECEMPAGNQRWLPGPDDKPWRETYTLALPATLPVGEYRLALKLRSAEAGRDVKLPLKAEMLGGDGFYTVGQVRVEHY